ncbi:undecaprenyldiphospho-muramoylpentapeptide beta-N-acetylglucosaminyltransferase [Corynebacterium kutscheri]|uniref:UDP-N-acetylglucosamine--N-acetylmuramyl-(pentapeptide) pyrophosphoryl-undecaprenol N-acetylglucosamine transferase n=1 Tax=Corynebacterium kutscheri TaxID=35755 RepID=A0A0F6R0Y5_9CORY|nr:undecaprenyldiphospho-muramoylpentapeptide beta-N-acetylglucosaminyltransferase [Corynebacterium kutscheri]AKE41560.1 UDP-N-acetylglucosamine-N-acetylmuramylpentapeptide N-acetylglucosamine transferase [Corynebacterium kutscheri]VEH08839.1 undecaprenyldiphospho-muramoylpentapeptide beta-N-acetylglucosaminyltransferase [Corynebacterium kutscheri]VEH09884.1 undecaprenyldiphospho-muramoylpentapeptide beta-N-acetylglucosaminyltransferase [Corynebacterium kutscheri]VEH79968.1 undecaprenyldiphosph
MTKVIVAGGGTAGHIEPALAVAEALKEHGVEVAALGTVKGLESRIVPERGVELKLINPVPVPRKIGADLFALPVNLFKTVAQTRRTFKEFGCDAVIGFGGYVSAPAYLAAKSLRLPFFVHESNARAGMANKLGVGLGGIGLNATQDSGMKGEVVGIPIRDSLRADVAAARERGKKLFGLTGDKTTILVTGGSQGAQSINTAIVEAVPELLQQGFQIVHAYGRKNEAPQAQPGYVPVPYIDDMAAGYAIADLIICRSGAMTVAEVSALGIPAVYIPLPHGNGEQGLNAAAVVEAGAAVLVADASLNSATIIDLVSQLAGDPQRLAVMRDALSHTGFNNVAGVIAEKIMAAIKNEGK